MKILLTVLIFVTSLSLYAQFNNSLFNNFENISENDSLKLNFDISNQNFLHNNEYFNNLYDGYTYLGYSLLPNLTFQPVKNLKIRAGWYLMKYSGKTDFWKSVPYYNCQYKFAKNINLILGNIYGLTEHNVIEPLYSFDNQFTKAPEQGIQILSNFNHFESDIWLNWENFIVPKDTAQEQFTLASTIIIKTCNKNNKLQINIPLQGLAYHKGGQGNYTTTNYLQTYFNSAIGIEAEYRLSANSEKIIGTKNYFATYTDVSDTIMHYYSKGYGFYCTLFSKFKNFDFMIGYWHSKHFIAPKGDFLFQSVSSKYTIWWEPNKQIVTTKLQYSYNISQNVKIALRGESYFDIIRKNFDYSYSLFLIVNQSFFIKKFSNATNKY